MRTRGLVGLLLGSTVRKIYDNPSSSGAIDRSKDLDVMILNPHSQRNPGPFEWGVDWFVRPPNSFPTNSNVKTAYDLDPKPGYFYYSNDSIRGMDEERAMRLYREIVSDCLGGQADDGEVSRIVAKLPGKKAILPGLYLPEKETMEAIAKHCNQLVAADSNRLKFDSYDYLVPENQVPMGDVGIPVMPDAALRFRGA